MCKFCSNLKRIKDLDEKEYKKIIDYWRQRDLKARKLLVRLLINRNDYDLETQKRLFFEAMKFCHLIKESEVRNYASEITSEDF